ncbi:cation:proton antiporter [Ruegeria profundi]|uniref:Sodium:proton antiporter n=1 Tax=Ruegeria profundi TaxID=1685378 RepID=A0A0X3TPA8_9RHOB|nr:cation:proton antiporter [Ruegeria profundi]KUJ77582.1 sodium:proton antiporter [Ruegeria profundi]
MEFAGFLVTLGVLFLAGLAADQLGRATRLPRVTLLLLLGVSIGDAGLNVIPDDVAQWFDEVSIVALTMVAFLLGGSLTRKNLTRHGLAIFTVSLAIVFATLVIVTTGLSLLGLASGLALLLASIATATAPAAMADVIHQSGVKNDFTDTLKGIVAIDDAWGLIVFSVALVLVDQANGWSSVLSGAAWDLGGAIVLGCVLGAPSAYLTGRLKPGEPLQAEAIGIVFLAAGFALWLEVSLLVTAMTTGAVIGNFARHHDRAFHEIEHIQWPFMIIFFLLAGALLEVDALKLLGWAGVAFILLRIFSRLIGGVIGARLGGVPHQEVPWYGPALLPQAGVAIGMALVAGERFPEWASTIMAFTIASTVVFEIIGPPVTLAAILKVSKQSPKQ